MARKWANHVHVRSQDDGFGGRSSCSGNSSLSITSSSGGGRRSCICNINAYFNKLLCETRASSFQSAELHTKGCKDDLFFCLRHLLLFGRLIGIIPLGNLYLHQKSDGNNDTNISTRNLPSFRWRSLPAVLSVWAIVFMCLNMSVNFAGMVEKTFKGISHPTDFVVASSLFFQISQSILIYLFFLLRAKNLCELLRMWPQNKDAFTEADVHLKKHVNILGTVFMLSIIGENIVFHLTLFPICPLTQLQIVKERNMTAFEIYYNRGQQHWAAKVSYNPILTIVLFICNKLVVYASTYADAIIIVLCRATYRKFKVLSTEVEKYLEKPTNEESIDLGQFAWSMICKNYEEAYNFTTDLNDFISPLIFLSYFGNIFFVCVTIQSGFVKSSGCRFVDAIYFGTSVVQVVTRLILVTYSAAQVYERAKEMRQFVQRCPKEFYNQQIRRLECLTENPIGLTGLGCFTVTNKFMMSIANVVFTIEVMLSQTHAAYTRENKCQL